MRYSIIHFFLGALFCFLLLDTFSHADYLDDLKFSLKATVTKVQAFSKKTKEFFGDIITMGFVDKIKFLLQERLKANRENFYSHLEVSVRQDNQLCTGEREFLVKRKRKVIAALEKLLGVSLENKTIPTIAVVASGGGYRAMLGTTGFLSGLDKIGVLDATMYIAALSGSTWAVGSWIAADMPLERFKLYLRQVITKNIHKLEPDEAKMLASLIIAKLGYNTPITSVDLYGGLLANRLLAYFENRRQLVKLSDQMERVKNGDYPYPIYTAIDARSITSPDPLWFEFTPYEVGAAGVGVYIPAWSYGREFNAGKSINFAPEQSLGFNFGTFGSAFGVHLGLAWNEIADQLVDSSLKSLLVQKVIDPYQGKRMFWAQVGNWTYGMEGKELSDQKYLKLVDAGLAFNLPYPPVSGERPERKADIFIFCDMSAYGMKKEVKRCEEYARNRGLKFPVIDYEKIEEEVISIFKDELDSAVPIVIYLPRISNSTLWKMNKVKKEFKDYSFDDFDLDECTQKGFCKTTNFKYSLEQSKKVIDQMEFNVLLCKDLIVNEIRWMVEKKNKGV